MATGATNPTFLTAQLEELQQENEELREQIRKFQAQQTVARGAIVEAASEKEATARIAHQVVVEERATRAAVETQSSNVGLSVIIQVVTLFLVVALLAITAFWLPGEIANQVRRSTPIVTPGGTTIIPGR